MQGFVLPDFTDIVRKKAKGRVEAVTRAAGISRSTFYDKLRTGNFTVDELKGMDRVLSFTEQEKNLIWR